MKTKHTLRETASFPLSNKNSLRHFIKLALVGSVLTSGMAVADLRDYGPGTPVLNWPTFYRDQQNLPLGLCRSTAVDAINATMCFPTPTIASAFPGNIGDEIFYMNLNAFVGAIDQNIILRFVTAVEAAYGAGAPVQGDEMVFQRSRFVMSVNENAPDACVGDYTIVYPWGEKTFPDVQKGPRALFETFDVLGAPRDFQAALTGPIGPFLHWDGGLNGVDVGRDEVPLLRTPANGLMFGTDEFVGDPNVEHTYTGSPIIEYAKGATGQFITDLSGAKVPKYRLDGDLNTALSSTVTPQHQNYVKVIAPTNCDIGGTTEGINIFKQPMGSLLGQVWTAPIATKTAINDALYVRTATNVNIDVWAHSESGQELYVTGTGFDGGVRMTPEQTDPTSYQGHIVLGANAFVPSSVDLVNRSSNPVVKIAHDLADYIHISKAEYNPSTGILCVLAHTSDNLAPLTLTAKSGPYTPASLDANDKVGCPIPASSGDLSAVVTVPLTSNPTVEVSVKSNHGGSSTKLVTVLPIAGDNTLPTPLHAVDDIASTVAGGVFSDRNVTGNDTGAAAPTEIIVVDQPSITDATGETQIVGTATSTATGLAAGSVRFTPNSGFSGGLVSYTYLLRNGINVSNLASVTLDVGVSATPPTGNPDNFAVRNNATPFTVNVLANDVAATSTTITGIRIGTAPNASKGSVVINPDKSITYTSVSGATGNDSFTYIATSTLTNTALTADSAPIRVDVTLKGAAESIIAISRNKMTNTAGGGQRFDIRFTTTWPAVVTPPLTPMGICYLTAVANTSNTMVALPQARLIGKVLVDATGVVQLQTVGSKMYNAADYNPLTDVPLLPALRKYTIRCGTSNLANPLTATSALLTTYPSTATSTGTAP